MLAIPVDGTTPLDREATHLCEFIAQKDFCFLPAGKTRRLLQSVAELCADDWASFGRSWDRLERDAYMADGGTYRYRRHATFGALPSARRAHQAAHQPHFQSLHYNPMNGGIPRYFAPIESDIAHGEVLTALLTFCCALFSRLAPYYAWHIEVHQFRIDASGNTARPTPEGMHRDGVNFVFMLLMNRFNVRNGESTIYDRQGDPLGEYLMTTMLDAAILNDERVLHGVSPIERIDALAPACRDMLVITFCKK